MEIFGGEFNTETISAMNYKVYSVDIPEARNFIQGLLEWMRALSARVIPRIDIEAGHITAGLPENGNPENLNSVEQGGVIPEAPESEWVRNETSTFVPVHTFQQYAIDEIARFLGQDDRHVCLLESLLAQPADPWIERNNYKSKVVFFEETVFWPLTSQNGSTENIEEALGLSSPSIGFLSSVQDVGRFKVGEFLSLDTVQEVAENVQGIVTLAYDKEAYLVWYREAREK